MSHVAYQCAGCGADTDLPFAPKDDRPVYCRACYEGGQAAARPRVAKGRARRPAVAAELTRYVADAVAQASPCVSPMAPASSRVAVNAAGRNRVDLDNLAEDDLQLMYDIMLAVYRWRDGR